MDKHVTCLHTYIPRTTHGLLFSFGTDVTQSSSKLGSSRNAPRRTKKKKEEEEKKNLVIENARQITHCLLNNNWPLWKLNRKLDELVTSADDLALRNVTIPIHQWPLHEDQLHASTVVLWEAKQYVTEQSIIALYHCHVTWANRSEQNASCHSIGLAGQADLSTFCPDRQPSEQNSRD